MNWYQSTKWTAVGAIAAFPISVIVFIAGGTTTLTEQLLRIRYLTLMTSLIMLGYAMTRLNSDSEFQKDSAEFGTRLMVLLVPFTVNLYIAIIGMNADNPFAGRGLAIFIIMLIPTVFAGFEISGGSELEKQASKGVKTISFLLAPLIVVFLTDAFFQGPRRLIPHPFDYTTFEFYLIETLVLLLAVSIVRSSGTIEEAMASTTGTVEAAPEVEEATPDRNHQQMELELLSPEENDDDRILRACRNVIKYGAASVMGSSIFALLTLVTGIFGILSDYFFAGTILFLILSIPFIIYGSILFVVSLIQLTALEDRGDPFLRGVKQYGWFSLALLLSGILFILITFSYEMHPIIDWTIVTAFILASVLFPLTRITSTDPLQKQTKILLSLQLSHFIIFFSLLLVLDFNYAWPQFTTLTFGTVLNMFAFAFYLALRNLTKILDLAN